MTKALASAFWFTLLAIGSSIPTNAGVQEIGSPCPKDQAAAQAPDGRPLLCLAEQGWQPGFFTGTGFWPT